MPCAGNNASAISRRSEEHTSELQSHGTISYAVFCLKKKKHIPTPKSSLGAAGLSRRQFIVYSSLAAGATALPAWAATRGHYKSPNEKLNVAVIGAGGKGASDTDN